jgi:hypothetical protein
VLRTDGRGPDEVDLDRCTPLVRFDIGNTVTDGPDTSFIPSILNPELVRDADGEARPEAWQLVNNSGGWMHPIHIHLEQFKLLSREDSEGGERRPAEPHEAAGSWAAMPVIAEPAVIVRALTRLIVRRSDAPSGASRLPEAGSLR